MTATDRSINAAVRRGWTLPKDQHVWQWAEEHIPNDRTSAIRGLWRSDVTPWARAPMEAFRHYRARRIMVLGPSQGAKTTLALLCLEWSMVEDPGPSVWIAPNDDKKREVAKERILPSVRGSKVFAPLRTQDRFDISTGSLRLTSCTTDIVSAQSETALQQTPYRRLFGDEWRLWPAGLFSQQEKRARTYPNSVILNTSTPGDVGSEGHGAWEACEKWEWHFPCLGCGKLINLCVKKPWQTLMRWDTTDATRGKDGKWNMEALAPTLRLECPDCHHAHHDIAAVRKHIADVGAFYRTTDGAKWGSADIASAQVGFRYSGLLPTWIRWLDIFAEFQKAVGLMRLGNIEPFRVFVTETTTEFWDPAEADSGEVDEVKKADYTIETALPDRWDFRFLTIDVQMMELWGVVRDWKRDGSSRLVWAGRFDTWGEARAMQQKCGIKDWDCFMDARWKPENVYGKCVEFGWVALMGSPKPSFSHTIKSKTFQRIYSEKVRVDTSRGTAQQGQRKNIVSLYHWSNPWAKDILDRLRNGKGAPWEVAADVPDFYAKHMGGEVKKESRKTGAVKWEWVRIGSRPNHLWDCEAMQVVAASMEKILTGDAQDDK